MMKRRMKQFATLSVMGMMVLWNTLPVSAGVMNPPVKQYGHVLNGKSVKTSAYSAYASTTCSGSDVHSVTAQLTYSYRMGNLSYPERTKVATQKTAATASVNLGNSSYEIYYVSGYHKAVVGYQGYVKPIDGYS